MDGIDYRTTDMLKWGVGSGTGTGGNLTPLQLDLNFWQLYSRLLNLETNPPTAVNIASMTVVGTQWVVTMTDASTFGPFTLPIATFQLKGEWQNSFTYYELDIVEVPDVGLYLVRIQHTTPATPAPFDPLADDGLGNLLYLKLFGEGPRIYDFGFFLPGKPGEGAPAGEFLAAHAFGRDVVLPAGLTGSVAKLLTAPTSALSFDLQDATGVVGSIDFTAGNAVGTFSFAANIAYVNGGYIGIMPPAAVDATAKQLFVTILGRRGTV
jgi:hypothetical protein